MHRCIQWVIRQVSKNVKAIVSDNGTEFRNEEMKIWYQHKGIAHHPILPVWLNLCESTHSLIVRMSNAMVLQSGYP